MFVLIILALYSADVSASSIVSVTTQEFSSQARCLAAKKSVDALHNARLHLSCIAK